MPPWSMVCPASRGIGLQLAKELLRKTQVPVVATARKDLDKTKEDILSDLDVDESRLTVLQVDVTDESTIESAASHLKDQFPTKNNHLHLAYLIPGILHPEKSPSAITAASALETFQINTLSHLLLLKHLSPFLPRKSTSLPSSADLQGLPKQAVYALMSARVGSISDNRLGGWYSYRASKAAVNQIAKTFDIHLKGRAGEKAMAVALHPGTVKTGLSREFWGNVREEKLFSGEFAAERLVEVVRGLGEEGRGRVWDWEGKEVVP